MGSLRADIRLYKTATALAAWEGRLEVMAEDVRQAAKWVLAHRRRQRPMEKPSSNDGSDTDELLDQIMNSPLQDQDGGDKGQQPSQEGPESNGRDSTGDGPSNDGGEPPSSEQNAPSNGSNGHDQMQTFTASKPGQIKQLKLAQQKKKSQPSGTGSCNPISNSQQKRTRYVRSAPTDKPTNLAVDATLRAAACNGLSSDGTPIIHPHNY